MCEINTHEQIEEFAKFLQQTNLYWDLDPNDRKKISTVGHNAKMQGLKNAIIYVLSFCRGDENV